MTKHNQTEPVRFPILILIYIIALSLDGRCDMPDAAWRKYLKPLPKEAIHVITKILKCTTFGGAELSKRQQAKWKGLGCDSLEKDADMLRKKFSNNQKVIDALNCAQSAANAKSDCPKVEI